MIREELFKCISFWIICEEFSRCSIYRNRKEISIIFFGKPFWDMFWNVEANTILWELRSVVVDRWMLFIRELKASIQV